MAENTSEKTDDYALEGASTKRMAAAPDLPYRPRDPRAYRPKIGLIACGGITQHHLTAYKNAGYDVAVLCDLHPERVEKRRAAFYPDATVTTDYREVLARDDIEVVDIATHPQDRVTLIEDALNAGKHVLSQKPFVLDLDTGERLVAVAERNGRRLAVNQNGRWAPHWAYVRQAIAAGLIGDVVSVHMGVHWDHTWVRGTPFEKIRALVLYDFAIHWFDCAACLLGDRTPTSVYATRSPALGQEIGPPMLAQAAFTFPGGQGTLAFDAHLRHGAQDRTYIGGTKGSLLSEGPNLGEQAVTLFTEDGAASPALAGAWFPDGFHGTMAELLCAIEEDREPANSARNNLKSLALCFAAIASADEGVPKTPGTVRRLPPGSAPGA